MTRKRREEHLEDWNPLLLRFREVTPELPWEDSYRGVAREIIGICHTDFTRWKKGLGISDPKRKSLAQHLKKVGKTTDEILYFYEGDLSSSGAWRALKALEQDNS